MIKRVTAAFVALVLAGVAAVLVIQYANRADARALGDLETVPVIVVTAPISEGASASELEESTQIEQVPQAYLVDGAVDDLADIEGLVATSSLNVGEQISVARFATPGEVRAASAVALPEEAQDLHQVTVPLDKARALGGDIAVGDTVGVFMSYDVSATPEGYSISPDGTIQRAPKTADEGDSGGAGGDATFQTTTLTLHKVLVLRVEGGYVAPPSEVEEGEAAAQAQDTILVTLALEAPDAERMVFAMEWGSVWLSLEPEGADESDTGTVVVTIPNEARSVLQ
ncbi:Flp pilus assembly protein CpaB [Ornithinimicrobium faecis]|uniref:Flp pilus assembly protein CpaB n=1 Tax=Ornithinimicrobium faecis TaxID=2934158 RepID=UPI002118BF28|nr:RcpC/CpaB family pilus assembly protein [Ornithinimicrobium sp. HY1745]